MILSSVDAIQETPVDRYLQEQRDLSAVERFSRFHEAHDGPGQARYYRDLIPAQPPAPGQQYAFEVDLDACTGCKACVTACHSLNGLDDDEAWRSVHAWQGAGSAGAWQQTVTAACHHCVEPACLAGCPVDAYEKNPVTGIVVHLDDQCIGCSYCTLTCPYEVPVFNHRLGIVRKCDMCRDRLAANEAPACVQGCPNDAIRVSIVTIAEVRARAATHDVPGGPPSAITVPSSVYRTTRAEGAAQRQHLASPKHSRSHLPLVVMLVLTQLSVGALVGDFVLRRVLGGASAAGVAPFDAVLALMAGTLALLASVFHLGRPRYAYRAVIGLGHSWLSREVVAFGAFTAVAALYAAVVLVAPVPRSSSVVTALGALAAASGVVAVGCSAAVYVVTRRAAWRARFVGPTFVLTATVCGLAAVLWASELAWLVGSGGSAGPGGEIGRPIPGILVALVIVELAWEATVTWLTLGRGGAVAAPDRHLDPDLRGQLGARLAAAAIGGAGLLGAAVAIAADRAGLAFACATVTLVAFAAGELLQRELFFELSEPPR